MPSYDDLADAAVPIRCKAVLVGKDANHVLEEKMAGNLRRLDPFRELARMDPFHALDDFYRDFPLMQGLRGQGMGSRMCIDVSESDQAYTVEAEIPGVKREDIQISVEGNEVTVRASSKEEREDKQGQKLVSQERYYGEQYRSFTLPQAIDESKAEAKYQDGVLYLVLPKKAGGSSRQITVQ